MGGQAFPGDVEGIETMSGISGMQISCQISWTDVSSLRDGLAAARQAGFNAADVEIPCEPAFEAVSNALDDNGVEPTGLMLDLREIPWDLAILRSWAHYASGWGLRSLGARVGDRRGQSAEAVAGEVRRFLEASGSGLELRNRCGSRLEQLGDFQELFVRTPAERVTVVIDTLECHRASVDPRAALTQLADCATGLVLVDAVGDRQVPLGEGEVNIQSLLAHVKRVPGIRRLLLSPAASSTSAAEELSAERRRLQAMLAGV
jgi:sugar phosphate isomerase/epimerase